jgi:hypothetical protein
VTDNDGLDDSLGETVLLDIDLDGPLPVVAPTR